MNRRKALKKIGLSIGAVSFADWQNLRQVLAVEKKDRQAIDTVLKRYADEPAAQAEVVFENGQPSLMINNEWVYPFLGVSAGLLQTADEFTRGGIDLFQPIVGMQSFWLGPGRYDWTLFDQFLAELLEINDRALFLPRLQLNTPGWWKEQNPDALIKYALPVDPKKYDFTEKIEVQPGGHRWGIGREMYEASWASQKWRNDTGDMLKAFIQHIHATPLKSRIIGYHPTTGYTGEWGYTGPHSLPDVSACMQEKTGPPPPAEARLQTTFGLLRDPQKEKPVIEFYQRFHATVTEAILSICRHIKSNAPNKVLTGIYYAYLLENVNIQEIGYLDPEPVLKSSDVDFIAGPYSYLGGTRPDRKRGENDVVDHAGNWLGRARGVGADGGFRVLLESLRRHRKMYLVEIDASTYVEPQISGEGGQGKETEKGTLKILKRDLAQMFVKGTAGWLYDFGPLRSGTGWYTSEPVIDLMRQFSRWGTKRKNLNLAPVSEVLMVGDPESFFVTEHWTASAPYKGMGSRDFDFINHWFLAAQARSFFRIGAPMDFLYSFDLQPADFRRYKLIFINNLFYLDNDQTTALSAMLENSGATVVWYYAPGYVSPEKLDLPQMQKLTGMQFEVLTSPGPMMINTLFTLPKMANAFGLSDEKYPRFVVTDPDAEVFGRWADNDQPAFAIKEHQGWTSVYTGTAPLPVDILRWMADRAKVRLWSDQADIVYATEDAAMIVATRAGERTLFLPKAMAEIEGGPAARTHKLDLDFGEVKIFLAS